MNENMTAAPHKPMDDEEIRRRLEQVYEQVKQDGRFFSGLELALIGDLRRECEYRGSLAGEAWAAGCELAGQLTETTALWLMLAKNFGDLYFDLQRAEKERDKARAEVIRLRKALADAKAAGPPITIQDLVNFGGLNPFALKLVAESFKASQARPVVFEFDGVVFHLARSVMEEGGE